MPQKPKNEQGRVFSRDMIGTMRKDIAAAEGGKKERKPSPPPLEELQREFLKVEKMTREQPVVSGKETEELRASKKRARKMREQMMQDYEDQEKQKTRAAQEQEEVPQRRERDLERDRQRREEMLRRDRAQEMAFQRSKQQAVTPEQPAQPVPAELEQRRQAEKAPQRRAAQEYQQHLQEEQGHEAAKQQAIQEQQQHIRAERKREEAKQHHEAEQMRQLEERRKRILADMREQALERVKKLDDPRAQKQLLSEQKTQLEKEQRSLAQLVREVRAEARPLRTKRTVLLKDIEEAEKAFATITHQEGQIEARQQQIEEKEAAAATTQERRDFEQQRWRIEEERQAIEKKRWPLGIRIEQLQGRLATLDVEDQGIKAREEEIQKKQAHLKEEERKADLKLERLTLKEQQARLIPSREMLQAEKAELLTHVTAIDEKISTINAEETSVEAEKQLFEEQEKAATNPQARREIEQKRWKTAAGRREIEQQRWRAEKEKEEAEKRLKQLGGREETLKKAEQEIAQKLQRIEETLGGATEELPAPEKEKPAPPQKEIAPPKELIVEASKGVVTSATQEHGEDREAEQKMEEARRRIAELKKGLTETEQATAEKRAAAEAAALRGPAPKSEEPEPKKPASKAGEPTLDDQARKEALRRALMARIEGGTSSRPPARSTKTPEQLYTVPTRQESFAQKPRPQAAKPTPPPKPSEALGALPKRPSGGEKMWVRFLILAIVIVVLVGIVTFWYWYLVIRTRPATPPTEPTPAELTPTEPALTASPEEEPLPAVALPQALFPVEGTRELPFADSIEVPWLITQTLQEWQHTDEFQRVLLKNSGEGRFVSLQEFLDALQVRLPETFLAQLADQFTIFVYSQLEGNRIGFVSEIKDTAVLQALLSDREPILFEDMRTLFTLSGLPENQSPLVESFADANLIRGYEGPNFRYQTVTRQDLGVCYMVTDQYMVMTTSWRGMEKAARKMGFLPPLSMLTKDLRFGSRGEEVVVLQKWLARDSAVYPDALITGYFDELTEAAVMRFQEKFESDTLAPQGFSEGTGSVDVATRAKLNELYGTPN